MPSKNSIKTYVEGGVYHVYNRGVNKQNIFVDDEDYSYFLTLLERYLIDGKISGYSNSFYNKIGLYSFCLMPSHIHLVLEQVERVNMTGFVRALSISYVMYINKKYQRVGHLFQDKYKARLITNEESFLATTTYVHKNPVDICPNIYTYPYSSLSDLTQNNRKFKFVKTDKLLNYFGFSKSAYTNHIKGSDLPACAGRGPAWVGPL